MNEEQKMDELQKEELSAREQRTAELEQSFSYDGYQIVRKIGRASCRERV